MRRLLLFLFVCLGVNAAYAQLEIEECMDQTQITLASFCDDACVICDIDGYTGTNSLPGLGEAPPGFCAGQLHNTQWVGFVANSTSLTLAISVFNCTVDQDGNGINEGLQIGIYNTTDCANFSLVSNCDDQVFDNTTQNFTANGLTVGGIYFVVLDGAFGDVCDFTIDVTNGSTTAPDVDQDVPNINSNLTVCQGGVLDVDVDDVFGAGAYIWSLDGDQVATDQQSSIQFPTDLGFYTLCVFPYNPCSEGVEGCVDIEVVPPVPEQLNAVICEGEEYSLAGEDYTEEDVYDIILTINGDCDRIIELTLDVIPIAETFLEEEICVNDFYMVGNEEFSQEGSYEVLLQSPATGCDSVVYLDLTVIGTEETTLLVESICEGDSYAIGGDQLTTGGSYFYELTDEVGCDSLVDLFLEVFPRPSSLTSATICTGESYLFNGTNYTATGNYQSVFSLPSGCDSVANLALTVVSSVSQTLNETICDGESFTVGTSNFSTTGNYAVPLVADNGCDSIVNLNLTVLGVIIEDGAASICDGETYTVDGNDFTTSGTYDLPYTASNGCDSIFRLTLTVLPVFTQTLNPNICAGQVFSFGGNDYSTTDTYVVTLPASNGCDSITTINLTVSDQITSTEDIVLCDGESIMVDGMTLDATGTFDFTFTSAGGCDSLATINLTIGDPIVTNLTETICQGVSYTVGTETFDMTGMYTVVLTAADGCDSTVNLNLTVTDPPVSLTEVTICEGESYDFNGQVFTNPGSYTSALVTPLGCDSIANLELTVTATIETFITPTICTGTSFEIGGDELTVAGNYTYTFPSAAGCDSIVSVTLLVEDAIYNILDETICEGESYTVGGNNYTLTGDYEDAFITLEGCDSIVQLSLTVIPTVFSNITARICAGEVFNAGGMDFDQTGIYTTTIDAASGCDSVITLNLTVVDIPDTPVNASICDSGSYTVGDSTFTVAGQYMVDLLSVDGCDSTIVLDLFVTDFYETNLSINRCEGESYTVGNNTYTMTGMYQNTFTSQDGCDSVVNLNLTVNPILRDTLFEELCQGESFSIAGVPYSTTGEHVETIASQVTGCDSIITLFLTVHPNENVTISETICDGEFVMVGDSTYTTTGSFFTPLTTMEGCDSIVTLNLNVIPIPETPLTEVICDGESITVGSNTYTVTGQYTDVLTSIVSGCDSIVYLDLTVNPLLETQLTEVICEGEVFNIGGVDYSTTGIHQELISSVVTGCDSTIILDLTVNPVFDQMISETICDGESVMVGDSTYTTTGTWPTLMTTVDGCDSLVTLELTVLPILSTTLSETLCAGETYTVGPSTYDVTGTYTDVLTSSFGCDSIVTLDLTVLAPIETFLIEEICDDADYTVGTEVFTATGDYTVVLTSPSTGCDSTVYLALTVNQTFVTTLNEDICLNDVFTVGGVDYNQTGTFQADLTTVDGCDSTVILNLVVAPCTLIYETSFTDNDCNGGENGSASFTMTIGTPPYSYTWNAIAGPQTGTGTIDGNGVTVEIPGLPAGAYQIEVTDANDVFATLNISVGQPTAMALQLEASSFGIYELSCPGAADGSLTASVTGGTPPYSYTWSNGATTETANDLAAGTYDLVVTDANGCTITASDVLEAPAPLAASLIVESPPCFDDLGGIVSVPLVEGGNGPYLYSIDGAAYTTASFFGNVSIGEHLISVQDINGCTYETVATVEQAPELTVSIQVDDDDLVYGESTELFAQTSYPVVTYEWSGGPIEDCADCATPFIKPSESVAYAVTVTDENGCTATDRLNVYVRKDRGVYIPNAFSPDDDGTNDIFMIHTDSDVVEIKSFYVFNRWGESMYEGFGFLPNSPGQGWDGRHRGEMLNAGVYIYMAEILFSDGETLIYKGDVVLMR
ncbi:MAG: gliding motility-associated C-terminal domain-containing protein [Lewinella sp.]|uniref:T9SS type B sorting domain-containing protein n=1 Tax=Lewinella sp. TaxID=2004506 RepID=UPI003D6A8BFD